MKQIPSQRYLQYAAACFLLATAFLLLYNYQQSYKVSNPHTLLPNNRLNDIDHPSTTRPLSDSRPAPSTNFLNLDAQSLPSGFYYPYSRPKHRVWQAGRKQARIHCKGPGGQLADDSSSSLLKAHAVSSSAPNPVPMFGAYGEAGLDDAHCFDRNGRLDPYGFQDDDTKFGKNSAVDWHNVDWGRLQDHCIAGNTKQLGKEERQVPVIHLRMPDPQNNNDDAWRSVHESTITKGKPDGHSNPHHKSRKAVILRGWDTLTYTSELRQHIRAMITELTLFTGGEFAVYLLVEIKDLSLPIWDSESAYASALASSVPSEFHNITLLFNEPLLQAWYPSIPPLNGQSVHMNQPLQLFSLANPHFTHIWGIELDVRYTGNWYNLLSSLHRFSLQQPRKLQWERAARFYIPSYHGSYANFTTSVQTMNPTGGVWGAVPNADIGPKPPTSAHDDEFDWGIGEEADDIVPSPVINPNGTGIFDKNVVTGFPPETERRALMVTPVKSLSRRLLGAMHRAQRDGLDMRSELFAHTIALAHGLKIVQVPVPMYYDDDKSGEEVEGIFNGGRETKDDVFVDDLDSDHMQDKGRTTFWWRLEFEQFPRQLYRRWYGLDEKGKKDEGTGRLCLPGLLLHPVKDVANDE